MEELKFAITFDRLAKAKVFLDPVNPRWSPAHFDTAIAFVDGARKFVGLREMLRGVADPWPSDPSTIVEYLAVGNVGNSILETDRENKTRWSQNKYGFQVGVVQLLRFVKTCCNI